MLPLVTLSGQNLTTTRLGFGTSRLHHVSAAVRADLIAAALGCGIQHFDTAPLYGDGLAERALGAALRGRRDHTIIATKVGLPPSKLVATLPSLAPAIQTVRVAGRLLRLPTRPRPPITPDMILRSVEQSLRRLQTDRIELLLLHEPSAETLQQADEVLATLANLRRAGKVLHFGLAGAASNLRTLDARLLSCGLIVQTHADTPLIHGKKADIVFGALSFGPQSFATSSSVEEVAVEHRIRAVMQAHPNACVLVSTRQPRRVESLARVASMVTEP